MDEAFRSPSCDLAVSNPSSGFAASSASIFGIIPMSGSHFHTFHSLLIRMPMRNTTMSSSHAVAAPANQQSKKWRLA
jgi:hypothetical protein